MREGRADVLEDLSGEVHDDVSPSDLVDEAFPDQVGGLAGHGLSAGCLVREVTGSPRAEAIVTSTLQLAHALGLVLPPEALWARLDDRAAVPAG